MFKQHTTIAATRALLVSALWYVHAGEVAVAAVTDDPAPATLASAGATAAPSSSHAMPLTRTGGATAATSPSAATPPGRAPVSATAAPPSSHAMPPTHAGGASAVSPTHVFSPAPAPAPAAAAAAVPTIKPPMTAAQVITVLDRSVNWYRTLGVQQQAANEPSDLLILYDNRQTAAKVMALVFDIARADADMLGKEPLGSGDTGDGSVSSQTLLQLRKKLELQSQSVQTEVDAERQRLASSTAHTRADVQAKLNELQSELELLDTKKTILDTMTGFAAGEDTSTAGALRAQIDAMAVAVPATAGALPAGQASAGSATANSQPSTPAPLGAAAASALGRFGLWDLASNVFRLSAKAGILASIDQRTADLQTAFKQIQSPLIEQIKSLSAYGDALAARADSADAATLNGVHDELDALAAQFKQASALLIPLNREGILLSQYRRNLSNWRDAAKTQTRDALQTLAIRLGVLSVILALLFGGAEVWRRTVLRYIQDSRRRYQLLLLRRIALWALVVIVIGIAFASELSSIATFAGLITAGIAVAMQSVLVSFVGYFFLIGKYGIRVGDRVQIGEVAGEVIDLGLVRMYLMELGAKGAMGPTGRVVAFANSVVFQVSTGLFKQIPGVNFSWRDVTLNLPAAGDYAAIKQKLTAAVNTALEDYRPEIVRQAREIERTTLSSSAGDPQPQVQLAFSATGVAAHVRYPVHLQHAAEIDERVTEALANVVSAEATPGRPA